MNTSATLSQTSETEWTLEKTGELDEANATVTWQIEATPVATVAGQLVVNGQMTVQNSGAGGATIGNIVANLQTKSGSAWITQSSDVADATDGDAATTANVVASASSEHRSYFTENAASGALEFMDATNNTLFSLVPQVTIGPGETKSLLFQAAFDNNVLHLADGTKVRAEVIVTFGNSAKSAVSAPNIDINGNGVIDADEARVRSVPVRLTLTVPAPVNGNGTVTLTDTIDEIAATGTVTFSNVVFDLGATSGTVTADVDGGADGGSITNCAHLTSPDQTVTSGGFTFQTIDSIDLTACDTQTIGAPPPCTPGEPGCGWSTGDMETASQGDWGDSTTAVGALLAANFNTLYPGDFVVGGINTIHLTDAAAAFSYLPALGSPAALTATVLDPLSTSAGELGGEVTALKLNTDFSLLFGNAVALADLRICDTPLPSLNGQTVAQFLTTANLILGGGSAALQASTANSVARLINGAFVSGTPSTFAQDNLVNGQCP